MPLQLPAMLKGAGPDGAAEVGWLGVLGVVEDEHPANPQSRTAAKKILVRVPLAMVDNRR